MKKHILLAFFVTFILSVTCFAGNAELFSYNKAAIEQEFSELNELEGYLAENTGLTLSDILSTNTVLAEKLIANGIGSSGSSASSFSIDEMDWGSFAWGFCCCPIGFFVVAINKNKDSIQKTSYWIGVAVSTILSAIGNIINLAAAG